MDDRWKRRRRRRERQSGGEKQPQWPQLKGGRGGVKVKQLFGVGGYEK